MPTVCSRWGYGEVPSLVQELSMMSTPAPGPPPDQGPGRGCAVRLHAAWGHRTAEPWGFHGRDGEVGDKRVGVGGEWRVKVWKEG